MSHPSAPTTLAALSKFKFERILNEDPVTHSLILLGTFPSPSSVSGSGLSFLEKEERVRGIIRIEKTALSAESAERLVGEMGMVERVELEESTDIYTWLFGWLGPERERDVKINVICPATEVHVRKYTKQNQIIVHETPELYSKLVKPYINAFPASRTQWVENILLGLSETDKILYSCPDFLILPDMKWDLKTLSSLYLVALVQDRSIRSLRDLRKGHVPMLRAIRDEAGRVVKDKWGIGDEKAKGGLRMYIHYQPSYYHFHVHIVNANYLGGNHGMAVGQAHLLDDIISLLEIDTIESGEEPGILQKMTFTYGLGDQHGLYELFSN